MGGAGYEHDVMTNRPLNLVFSLVDSCSFIHYSYLMSYINIRKTGLAVFSGYQYESMAIVRSIISWISSDLKNHSIPHVRNQSIALHVLTSAAHQTQIRALHCTQTHQHAYQLSVNQMHYRQPHLCNQNFQFCSTDHVAVELFDGHPSLFSFGAW